MQAPATKAGRAGLTAFTVREARPLKARLAIAEAAARLLLDGTDDALFCSSRDTA